MFDFIRTHQRLMQFLLLVLIVPPFAFWGIDGYKSFTDDAGALAKVGGYAITAQDFAQAQREQLERQRAIAANLKLPFDPAMFESAVAREAVLDGLINQRTLTTYSVKRGVVVTDDLLREKIMAIPAVQENGQFSKERYNNLLAAQGYTPPVFENKLRQDLSMQVLNSGVAESAFSPRAVQMMVMRAQGEEREIQEYLIKADAFATQVKITPEAVRAYYDANQKEFVQPARVKAEYLVLSVDSIAATLAVPADVAKSFYEQNIKRYTQEEQRQASHILVKFEDKVDRAALKAKAEDILKQARAPGADFAALAKKHSQDPGSAAQGGSLGSFGRGAMVKPFEDAVFSMKEGEISNLVESEFGYHIIKLTGIKAGKVRSLEEVRPEIEREWKQKEAQKKFTESAEGFTNTVYEQSDSLKAAAEKYKLTVAGTEYFTRSAPPKELSNPKLLERLFSDDAVKARRNTEALEVAPGVLVSARVADYKAQAARAFDEVKAEIQADLVRKEAAAMARKEGEARLKEAQAKPDALQFGASRAVSRSKAEGVAPDALRAIMSAPADKLPVVVGALAPAGYAVYRINKVNEIGGADAARMSAVRSALERAQAEGEFSGYVEGLRKAAKVVVHKENLDKKSN